MNSRPARLQLIKILWEIPILVLAVVMALVVENAAENRREVKKAQESLEAIWKEIDANKKKLALDFEGNQRQLDRFVQVRDSVEKFGSAGFELNLNYEHTLLSRAAWQRSILTGSTRRMDPQIVQQLSQIYELQEMFSELGTTYFKQISSIEFHRKEDKLSRVDAMASLLRITHGIANTLIAAYEVVSKPME